MISNHTSILILNYNTFELIESFFAHNFFEDPHVTWIVVDNGSKDAIQKNLIHYGTDHGWNIHAGNDNAINNPDYFIHHSGQNDGNVHLILLGKNYGYAIGNNLGLEFISKYICPEFVLIANTDVSWDFGILDKLVKPFQEDSTLAVVGPRIIGPNGGEQNPQFLPEKFKIMQSWFRLLFPFSVILYRIFSRQFDYQRTLENQGIKSGLFYIDPKKYCFMGSCFLIKFPIFKKIGFFDPSTFLGTEEPRLVHRLSDLGYKMAIDLDVSVIHDQGSTSKISFSSRKIMKFFDESDISYLRDYCRYPTFTLMFIRYTAYYYRNFWLPLFEVYNKMLERLNEDIFQKK